MQRDRRNVSTLSARRHSVVTQSVQDCLRVSETCSGRQPQWFFASRRRRDCRCAVCRARIAGTGSSTPVISVRVYDYAQLSIASIQQAQQRVMNIYKDIGVRIEWQSTARPAEQPSAHRPIAPGPRDLFVIVLNASMTRRAGAAMDVVGSAVVTPHQGGRVAYVFFDRVSRVANASGADASQVMGIVMAHEIGHLVLPSGSHSAGGSDASPLDHRRTAQRAAFSSRSIYKLARGNHSRASTPVGFHAFRHCDSVMAESRDQPVPQFRAPNRGERARGASRP